VFAERRADCPNQTRFMLNALLTALCRCAHERTTFPLTPVSRVGAPTPRPAVNGAYVACLDCGSEFRYDWAEMHIGEPLMHHREPVLSGR